MDSFESQFLGGVLLGASSVAAQVCDEGDPPPPIEVSLISRSADGGSASFSVRGMYETIQLAQLRLRTLGPDGDRTYSVSLTLFPDASTIVDVGLPPLSTGRSVIIVDVVRVSFLTDPDESPEVILTAMKGPIGLTLKTEQELGARDTDAVAIVAKRSDSVDWRPGSDGPADGED